VKQIALTKGYVTIVDDEDYESLSRHKWHVMVTKTGNAYAVRLVTRDGKQRAVLMHRQITGAPKGSHVDHANRNSLDNRRQNLRPCSSSQNASNHCKQRGTWSSRYKGVSWSSRAGKWRAYIVVQTKFKHLGYFDTENEAALTYNRAAKKHFGEFALPNDIAA
jgi:hypothetical protein